MRSFFESIGCYFEATRAWKIFSFRYTNLCLNWKFFYHQFSSRGKVFELLRCVHPCDVAAVRSLFLGENLPLFFCVNNANKFMSLILNFSYFLFKFSKRCWKRINRRNNKIFDDKSKIWESRRERVRGMWFSASIKICEYINFLYQLYFLSIELAEMCIRGLYPLRISYYWYGFGFGLHFDKFMFTFVFVERRIACVGI